MSPKALRTLIAVLAGGTLFAVAPASTAVGQRDPAAAPARRPGWLPRYSKFDPSLTPAEKATIQKRLNEIERLILQIPELARPEGFEVLPRVDAAGFEIWPVIQGHPKGKYVVQSYQLMAFRPSKAIAGEGLTCLEIIINPLPFQVFMYYAQNDFEDGKGDRLYIEHPFGEKMHGALLAYADKVFDWDEPNPPVKPIGCLRKTRAITPSSSARMGSRRGWR